MPFIQENSNGIILKVFVQPRSSKNMIAGRHGDALKIKLTAPPVDGAANKMCIQHLAKWLKITKSSIEIISGHNSRTKRLLLRSKKEKSAISIEKKRVKTLISSLLNS
ncbi:MAG: YggU family protein [Deltaproteobacteria bacterium]|nr:YggU family protein [Deltaproteobacteria bacterium]